MGVRMTEIELAEIESRLQAELATEAWSSDPDASYDLLRDEMPRLLAEVRRLRAQAQVYRDGLAALETGIAEEILDRALRVGRSRPPAAGRVPNAADASQEAILRALEQDLQIEIGKQRK